jgi:hypothetical protein
MKIDRYRELMNHIDTDLACDDRIKDELRFCEFYEMDEKSVFSLKEKSAIRKHPILTALQSISMAGRLLTSLAFLAVLLIVFISSHFHLRSTVPTNNNSSISPITQESQDNKDFTPNTVEKATENAMKEEDIYTTIDSTDLPKDTNVATPEKDVNTNNTSVVADDAKTGDFYLAHFDVIADKKVKSSIPNLVIRLHGLVDSINMDDLTDIVLTRDGLPIDNGITFVSKTDQFEWDYEYITDFYFKFTTNNTEPGNYGLTGKYKGVPFEVYNKIIEAEITDVAANPEDLNQVTFMGRMDEENNWTQFSEVVVSFNGLQNSFYVSDLSDLKITCNDKEIPYSFESSVFRYYEVSYDNNADTAFNLVLTNKLTDPGVYVITGKYKGVPFVSNEMLIP